MTVFYIVVAVLVLLFGVFSYLNAANWNVLHVLALFFTFGAGFAYLVILAAVLRTETAWKQHVESLEERLAQLQTSTDLLEKGTALNPQTGRLQAVDNPTQSLVGARAELSRALYNRGRVWRNVQRGQINNGAVTLTFPNIQAPPAGGEPNQQGAPAGGPAQRSLQANDLVYAFGQMPHPEDPELPVPAYFVGEFVVEGVQGQNVTVRSTTPLDQSQQSVLNRQNPWTLYDEMPVDERRIFQEMEPEALVNLFHGAFSRVQLPQQLADRAIANIQRHGQPAQPDDPELAVMSKVTFQQEYEAEVDAETAATGIAQVYEPASGLATAPFLKQGEPTKFNQGDSIILPTDREPGKSLVDQGIVTIDQKVYVRPLNDYTFKLAAYKRRVEAIKDQAFTLNRDINMLKESEQIAKEVVAYRTQEKQNLQQDKTKVVYELEQVEQYKQKLLSYLTDTLRTNSQLYRTNQTLVDQLQKAHEEVLRRANQRSPDEADDEALTLAN